MLRVSTQPFSVGETGDCFWAVAYRGWVSHNHTFMWRYIKAAFNARPIGMIVPPNWIGMAAFALLGFVHPGFLLIGAGLELLYLYMLSTNSRFQRLVDARKLSDEHRRWADRLSSMLAELEGADQQRYRNLEQRCQTILAQQARNPLTRELDVQGHGLGRLLWIYLRLLATRQSLVRVLRESSSVDHEPLDERVQRLQRRLSEPDLDANLRRSYEGQLQIMEQRLARQAEARRKLAYLESELTRIEQQVELIREQSAVATDPDTLSQRIDEIGATLSSTNDWIRDQQRIYGNIQDLLEEPPPVTVPSAPREALKQ